MDTLSPIGILGVGNLLLSDEGFGVHFIRYLNSRYTLPDQVAILDGGTSGIMLAPFIEDVRLLYVIDTVAVAAEPGSIHCFSEDDVRAGNIQARMSPHQVGLLEILDICRLRDKAPERVRMITVVPADLGTGIDLSARLRPKLAEVMAVLAGLLARENVFPQEKETVCRA